MTTAPMKPLPRQGHRIRLEQARESLATLAMQKTAELHVIAGLMAITTDLWEATQPDEAPEIAMFPRLVRAS